MQILAFAASNSHTSINRKLVGYAAELLKGGLVPNAAVEIVDLNDYEMPLYRPDRQAAGIPREAVDFYDKIGRSDAVVVSFAEHNGMVSAAFKNLYDWMSRINMAVYQQKRVVMLATSVGGRGGKGALESAALVAPFFGADLRGTFSLPSFPQNFDAETGRISNDELRLALESVLVKLND